ncbi:MAG: hypothetical protein ACD_62C00691G0006 [uncultured bacterium]|nr:MAG: hypothetical protein ACD_62C00691G0006 [uncultured bacterium]HLD44318.1 hypothetical protein [bacterium]
MEEKKFSPCFCTAILGLLVIVLAWWDFSWSGIALTIIGLLVIAKGLINQCCCPRSKTKDSCCQ